MLWLLVAALTHTQADVNEHVFILVGILSVINGLNYHLLLSQVFCVSPDSISNYPELLALAEPGDLVCYSYLYCSAQ